MKKWLGATFWLVLSLFSPSAFAEGFDLFTSPGTDRSLQYLGKILGSVGDLPIGGGNNALADLFSILNSVLLSFALIIAFYTVVISIINTAVEGEVMGKKWSVVLIPIKMGLGLMLLLPQPGGYCLAQIFIGWLVVNGVGAANGVWGVVLDHKLKGESINQLDKDKTGKVIIPPYDKDISLATKMWQVAVCTAYFNNHRYVDPTSTIPDDGSVTLGDLNLGKPENNAYYGAVTPFDAKVTNMSNAIVFDYEFNNTQPRTHENPVCGAIGVTVLSSNATFLSAVGSSLETETYLKIMTNTVRDFEAAKQIESEAFNKLQRIMIKMMAKAEEVIDDSKEYKRFSTTANDKDTPADAKEQSARRKFLIGIQDEINEITASVAGDTGSAFSKSEIEQARADGWVHAGTYYFKLAARNMQKTYIDFKQIITVTPPDSSSYTSSGAPKVIEQAKDAKIGVGLAPYTERYLPTISDLSENDWKQFSPKYSDYLEKQETVLRSGINISSTNSLKRMPKPFNYLSEGFQKIALVFTKHLTTRSDDPIISLARTGGEIMMVIEALWITLMIAVVALQIIVGVQSCVNPTPWAVEGVINIVTPVVTALIALLWGFGATLAIWTPLVPFSIFLVAVFGWFIGIIEAFVGAPLIALGLIMPSEDELGKAAHSTMLMLSVFLRPMLMIIGFIAGSKLLIVAVGMINFGFSGTVASQNISGSLFSFVPIIAIYVGLILTSVNRCFSLIYHVPDKVMRWIGGSATGEFDQEMEGKMKGFQDKGSKSASDMSQGAATGAAKLDFKKKK